MANSTVIAIQSCVIITIVYALITPVFFEMDNAHGEAANFVDNEKIYAQQSVVETECKSPCPSSAEICIAMCA